MAERPLLHIEKQFGIQQIKKNPLAGGLFKNWSTQPHKQCIGERKRKLSLPVCTNDCKYYRLKRQYWLMDLHGSGVMDVVDTSDLSECIPHSAQYIGSGNRCGHDPQKPAWHLYNAKHTEKMIPHVIRKLQEKALSYYDSPKLLPTLANLNGKTNQDGQPRLNRSEAREADALVLCAILSMTEYATLRVGTPLNNGDFIPRSCSEIAKVSGLIREDGDPSQRFWRAFRRLKLAGAFNVHRQYQEMPDGSKRARPAIKNLNFHFLVALGAVGYERLKKFRTWCSNKLKKARATHREEFPTQNDAKHARSRLRMSQLTEGVNTHAFKTKRTKVIADSDENKELRRMFSLEQIEATSELMASGMNGADVRAEIKRRFGSFEAWAKAKTS